jgi:CheY-like chemotaxis protein
MSTHTQTVFSFLSIKERLAESTVTSADFRLQVLVVDDSEDLRELISTLLRVQFRVNVVGEAGNGSEALEKIEELHPDMVLMDVHMPRMNGIDAAGIITRNYPETMVVLMSGDDSPQLRAQAMACGAQTLIYKPKLTEEIASVLASKEHG